MYVEISLLASIPVTLLNEHIHTKTYIHRHIHGCRLGQAYTHLRLHAHCSDIYSFSLADIARHLHLLFPASI